MLTLPDSPAPPAAGDARMRAPAAARNRDAIAAALRRHLPERGRLLEIASGTGEHACHLARVFPGLRYLPSDVDAARLASIAAWRASDGPENLDPPLRLDCCARPWPVEPGSFDAALAVNLLHLLPWPGVEACLAGAAAALRPGGVLAVYGPFRRGAGFASSGDEAFDASLRAQDPALGLRDHGAVEAAASRAALRPRALESMPADNLLLVFRRS
jgi:SAM-dependent methyltransferase